jgi:peroxiredoxin
MATLQGAQHSTADLPPLLNPQTDTPGLRVGEKVPAGITVYDEQGNEVSLNDQFASGLTVVIFYRGGWCPFCNKSLKEWGREVGRFNERDINVIAISPESAEHQQETTQKLNVGFDVYVDKTTEAMRSFKLAFQVDDDYLDMLQKRLDVDLGNWNASGETILPAPGTFLIDEQGIIKWAHADWNYKKRASPDDILSILDEYE